MQKIAISFAAVAAVFALSAANVHAQYNVPFKGKSIKVNMMTHYLPCTAPDTVTGDNVPACTTLQRADPNCGFGGGQGKIQLKGQTPGNTDIRIKFLGMDQLCEGETITFHVSGHKTGHYCASNAICSTVQTTVQIGSCKVYREVCKAQGQFVFPGGPQNGELEVTDIWAEHNGIRSFNMGIVNNNPQN